MKIFSNFDTNNKKKTIETYKQQFWEDKVFAIEKSKYFLYMRVIFPAVFYILAISLFLYGMFLFVGNGLFLTIVSLIAIFGLIVILFPIVKRYIDYLMDFVLITPKFLVRYNQEWLFKRLSKTIAATSIRTIAVRKSWVLYSMFNNGDIIFLAEWWGGEAELEWNLWDGWSNEIGEIVFTHVSKPEKVRRKIVDTMQLIA